MTHNHLVLRGCAPTPLASYLKALGVLRLLSSDANNIRGAPADPYVRGWWEDERFHLRTSLGRDEVLAFFLHDYAPSPIIAPWNGRAGFLEGDTGQDSTREGAVLIREIEHSKAARLRNMRSTIHVLRGTRLLTTLDDLRAQSKSLGKRIKTLQGKARQDCQEEKGSVDTREKLIKSTLLLPSLRSQTTTEHVVYMDACVALASNPVYAPLLVSGGVDGSRDFGVNYATHVTRVIDLADGTPRDHTAAELQSALFGFTHLTRGRGSMGMYTPGHGGYNATTGYESTGSPLNSWDQILGMEGILVFVGALTRRWIVAGTNRGAFPFSFRPTTAGAGRLSGDDRNRARGEIWTPLWDRPAASSEVASIFAEGRLTIGRQAAQNGLDAARAISRLGLQRGIRAFERYTLVVPGRNQLHQATPLGRFVIPERTRRDLTSDLDAHGWLNSVRSWTSNRKRCPAQGRTLIRQIEDALFQMTKGSQALVARGARCGLTRIGDFVQWLVPNQQARSAMRPPPLLSREWLFSADDGSPEFRIAAALAGLGIPDRVEQTLSPNEAPPMAAHLAPLTNRRRSGFAEKTPPTVVWGHGGLVGNLITVLERRLVEASVRRLEDKPLDSAGFARLSDVAAFLRGGFDDRRCAALLAGMVWARPVRFQNKKREPAPERVTLPFAYEVLKPIFSPNRALVRIGAIPVGATIPIPPGLISQLRGSGNNTNGRAINRTVRTAFARARASGLPSPFDPVISGGNRSAPSARRIGVGVSPQRLAAALLIPVHDRALTRLINRVYPDPSQNHQSNEGHDNGS